MLFKILFIDNTSFISNGNYFDTKWKEIPDKQIKQIAFRVPSGDFIVLHDYEAYNFFIEGTVDIYSKDKRTIGKQIPRFIHIRGKSKSKIASYRVTLFDSGDKQKYRIADITYRVLDWLKDDRGVNSSIGWKSGIGFEVPENLKTHPKGK